MRTLSDLGGLLQRDPGAATLCVGSEFAARDDGLPGLEQHYGYQFPADNVALVQDAVVYSQVDKGERCNFGEVFTTDGRIVALDLVVLEDDKDFFPKFNPALNVRQDVFEQYADLEDLFAEIASALDEETMTRLNAQVDVDGDFPEEVAERWLRDEGLVT